MMDKRDFEKLVFEKADALKARDRRNKMIRISVIPAAAAFAVISLVGIRNIFYLPNSTSASFSDAAIANTSIPDGTQKNAAPAEVNEDVKNDDLTASAYSYENEDAGEAFAPPYEETQTTTTTATTAAADTEQSAGYAVPNVSFDTNTQYFLSDGDAQIIAAALDREYTEEEFPDSGFLGTVTVDNIRYSIYETHVKAEENGVEIGQYPLDDETKQTIENILPIRFGSLR